jgi:hypothetical protein
LRIGIIDTVEQGEIAMLECKTFSICLATTLLMFLLPYSEPMRAQEKQHSITPPTTEYRIQVGDIIKLDVWKEPKITRTIPRRKSRGPDRNGIGWPAPQQTRRQNS